jgi:peroxiredoxin
MQLKHVCLMFVAVAALSLAALAQDAAKPHKRRGMGAATGVKVGEAAPDFELKGADGKMYKLSQFKDKTVVLEWLNQDCPFSNCKTGVGPKSKALAEKYKAKGVVWLGIDSTYGRTAEKEADYIKENNIPYPILLDSDGAVGHKYGATNTPHMFVIHQGKVMYAGAFSTHPQSPEAKSDYRGYVDEAVSAVLAGKEVPVSSVKPWGCNVKYKRKK